MSSFVGFEKQAKVEDLTNSPTSSVKNPKLQQQQRCEEEGPSVQIIPGLPDHVTATLIFSRIPWSHLPNLSLVSRAWRRAFESRYVYDALGPPVSCIRETFLIVNIRHPKSPPEADASREWDDPSFPREEYAISLYDTGRDVWNLLPDLPNGIRGRGIPFECAWAVLDRKLYILGGEDEDRMPRADVYMLDFASCRRVWHTCASMSRPRSRFACHALNGKLYALGGSSSTLHGYSKEAEVYEPGQNAWNPVAGMLHHHIYHNVVELKKEIYVQGGVTVHELSPDGLDVVRIGLPNFVESYNPGLNGWKKIENFNPIDLDFGLQYLLVVVDDRMFKLKPGLRVGSYDVLSNSWTDLDKSVYLPEGLFDFGGDDNVPLYAAVALRDEIFVIISGSNFGDLHRISMLKSKGFCSYDGCIVWETCSCPRPFGRDFQLLAAFEL